MMRPTFLGFEAARTALYATQKALDVTGHNLSNINTDGYTRQRVDQVSVSAGSYTARYNINMVTYAGMGTNVRGVEQLRNQQLDQAYRNECSNNGYYQQRSDMLSDIESTLQELDDGTSGNGYALKFAVEQLYTNLQDFSSNANSEAHANTVAASMDNLAKTIAKKYDDLDKTAASYRDDLKNHVDDINKTLNEIADLNTSIKASMLSNNYTDGFGPNELLDKRNMLLDNLAKNGEIRVSTNDDGTVTVEMNNHVVVKDNQFEKIMYGQTNDGAVTLSWKSDGKEINPGSGTLKAYVDILNGRGAKPVNANETNERGFLYYKDKLDSFAKTVANVFNNIVPKRDDDGNILKDDSGNIQYKQLFGASLGNGEVSSDDKITADNITITNQLSKDTSYLIDKKDSTDNTTILNMIDKLTNDKISFETSGDNFTGTFEDFIKDYNVTLGNDMSYSSSRLESSTNIINEISESRDQVSGVSETEETSNMLVYNRAFQAAARMMTTMDGLLDIIINKMAI